MGISDSDIEYFDNLIKELTPEGWIPFHYYTLEEDKKIFRLMNSGTPGKEIAKQLGRTLASIRYRIRLIKMLPPKIEYLDALPRDKSVR